MEGYRDLTVTLTPAEAKFATDLGHAIGEWAWARKSVHRNNLRTDYRTTIRLHVRGKWGEAGLFKFLGGEANGVFWDTRVGRPQGGEPDIVCKGVAYDAKAVEDNRLNLMHDAHGRVLIKPRFRYVLVGVERLPTCHLLGWAWGKELRAQPPQERVKGRPAHFIDQGTGLMRDCAEFEYVPPNTFFGHCFCGRPGLYWDNGVRTCNEHRW
jgi:hypothetical protein